jgi:hypothetical protein
MNKICTTSIFTAAISGLALCVFTSQAAGAAPASARDNNNAQRAAATAKGQVTIEELNELTNGYADRYMTYIVNAAQKIEAENPNAEQRRFINQVQLVQVSSIYDIVTTADPFTQLIDLVLVVSLQARKWIDDDEAEKSFGERGKYLIDASRRAREDIWKVAARILKPDQLEQLDYMITDWHKRNPDIKLVSYVRFDDFASSRGKSMIADVRSGGGFLAVVDDAKKSVDEVRLLAERAFYLGKRMPLMVNWHVKAAVGDALSDPSIQKMQEAVPQITDSVNRITSTLEKTVEKVPLDIAKERAAFFDAVSQQQPFIQSTLAQVRGTVQDTDRLTGSAIKVTKSVDALLKQVNLTNAELNQTVGTIDKVFLSPGRNAPADPSAKPFDIEQYTRSAVQLTGALKEANELLVGTSKLLQSPALSKPMEAVSEHSTRVMDAALWRAALLIVFFFVMLASYRTYTSKVLSRRTGA